jgi:hypothetical protein
MKLGKTVSIKHPSYIADNNELVSGKTSTFDELNITYCDSPFTRKYYLHIAELDAYGLYFLFEDDVYDTLSPISRDTAIMHFKARLGDDPESFLQNLFPKTLEDNPNGPGTILSNMLGVIGIKSSENCSCKRHAIEMNMRGPEWCLNNLDTVISWLKEESSKRNWPFIDSIARLMVKKAISKSQRLLKKESQLANA